MVKKFLASGLMLLILSAFFFALTDIVIKFVSPSIGAIQIAFFRYFFGGLILWTLLASSGRSLKGTDTKILLTGGLFSTLAFFCFIKSIAMIPLSNAMVLLYTFPLFAAIFSSLLLKERFKKLEIVLAVVGMIGIYILFDPASHSYTMGHVFGLLAGVCTGLFVVLIRKLRKDNGPLIIYFYCCIVGVIVLLPYFVLRFKTPDLEQLCVLAVLAVIFLIAQLLLNQGFKFCKAPEGSVILMSEVVFAGIAGVVIFKDSLSPGFWAGASLIVGSGVALNLINRGTHSSDALSGP